MQLQQLWKATTQQLLKYVSIFDLQQFNFKNSKLQLLLHTKMVRFASETPSKIPVYPSNSAANKERIVKSSYDFEFSQKISQNCAKIRKYILYFVNYVYHDPACKFVYNE